MAAILRVAGGSETDQRLGFLFFLLQLLTVVVGHGYDGQDKVDQVERAHEDHDYEEYDVERTVRRKDLKHQKPNT